MCVSIASAAILSYGMAEGPWFTVLYPQKSQNAFTESIQYVDAIAEHDRNKATVYIKNKENIDALEESGAILLDPKGVPLCLKP